MYAIRSYYADGVSNFGFAQNTSSPTSGETYAFKNSLDPTTQDFQLGKGIGISGGKSFNIGANHNPLSFYIIGNYSNDFSFTDGTTRQTTTSGVIYRDQNTRITSYNVCYTKLLRYVAKVHIS